jgi:general secretion pathway protein D
MVFLRPTILRDEQQADVLTGERYDYIRGQQLHAEPTPGAVHRGDPLPLLPHLPADAGKRP